MPSGSSSGEEQKFTKIRFPLATGPKRVLIVLPTFVQFLQQPIDFHYVEHHLSTSKPHLLFLTEREVSMATYSFIVLLI